MKPPRDRIVVIGVGPVKGGRCHRCQKDVPRGDLALIRFEVIQSTAISQNKGDIPQAVPVAVWHLQCAILDGIIITGLDVMPLPPKPAKPGSNVRHGYNSEMYFGDDKMAADKRILRARLREDLARHLFEDLDRRMMEEPSRTDNRREHLAELEKLMADVSKGPDDPGVTEGEE